MNPIKTSPIKFDEHVENTQMNVFQHKACDQQACFNM